MCGMMFNLERSILVSEQYNAHPKPQVMSKTIVGLLENYYSDINKNIVLDKSREWSMKEHFEVLMRNLPYPPKVILTVRDIHDVLASFMYLVHENPTSVSFIDQEIEARGEFNLYRHPDDIRCDHLMRPKGLIDNALYGIAYACLPENLEYFHFVEYENLISNPKQTLESIYSFLEIEPFNHTFDNIQNNIEESEEIYGLPGIHEVRPQILKREINKLEHLSPYILNKYNGLEFWRALEGQG